MSFQDSDWIRAREKRFKLIEELAPCDFIPYSNREEQNNQVWTPSFLKLRNQKKEFISKVAENLRDTLNIKMKSETDSYGSGYSSYDAFYFFRDEDFTTGVIVYISREVPAYTWAEHDNSSGMFMDTQLIENIPNAFWEDSVKQIHQHLKSTGFKHIPKNLLIQDVSFNALLGSDMPFDNIYTKAHKDKIFDLLFHWSS